MSDEVYQELDEQELLERYAHKGSGYVTEGEIYYMRKHRFISPRGGYNPDVLTNAIWDKAIASLISDDGMPIAFIKADDRDTLCEHIIAGGVPFDHIIVSGSQDKHFDWVSDKLSESLRHNIRQVLFKQVWTDDRWEVHYKRESYIRDIGNMGGMGWMCRVFYNLVYKVDE